MASIEKHEITVTEKKNERYAYLVECVCGWQGRCGTITESDQLANRHLQSQSTLAANSGIRLGGL